MPSATSPNFWSTRLKWPSINQLYTNLFLRTNVLPFQKQHTFLTNVKNYKLFTILTSDRWL
jgi:hypothetical protein